MMTMRPMLLALLLAATPLSAQEVTVDSLRLDSLRIEAIRSRGFIRAAETQLSKVVGLLARLGVEVPPDTVPTEPPVEPPPDTVPSEPPPVPPGDAVVLAASDFTDMSGWVVSMNGDVEIRSTAADGLDFPTPNYLQVWSNSGHRDLYWGTVPSIGSTLTISFYRRMQIADDCACDGETHGIYGTRSVTDGWGSPQLQWGIYDRTRNDGTWLPILNGYTRTATGDVNFPQRYWVPPVWLDKDVTYLEAYSYTRTGDTTYRLGVTISRLDGTVVYTESDYRDAWWGSGSNVLSEYEFDGPSAELMTGLRIGLNGMDPMPAVRSRYYAIADVRVTLR